MVLHNTWHYHSQVTLPIFSLNLHPVKLRNSYLDSLSNSHAFIEASVPLRMLRARNLPLILSFCYREFKTAQQISIPFQLLVQKLAEYLEDHNYGEADEEILNTGNRLILDYHEKARMYLEKWIDRQYLRNVMDEQLREPVVMLSRHIERVYRTLDMLSDREFVSTESKFRDLFHKLRDLIENANPDADTRLADLERKKAEIEAQIQRIKADGFVSTYEDYQIKSRFEDIQTLSEALISDFREVEDNFKDITRKIYEKQQNQDLTKGQLISETFDALFELRNTDQGKSFYAFWQFMLDDKSQEDLQELTRDLYEVLDDRGIEYSDKLLRRLKSLLHQAGRKVLEKNDLLADKLSREIVAKDALESRKFREIMNQVRQMALKMAGTNPVRTEWMSFEGNPDIYLPMERKLGEKASDDQFVSMPGMAKAGIADLDQLSKLYSHDLIDKKALMQNIRTLLKEKSQVSLKEVVDHYGISRGLPELLSYVSLIAQFPACTINEDRRESIEFDPVQGKFLDLPQIIFAV